MPDEIEPGCAESDAVRYSAERSAAAPSSWIARNDRFLRAVCMISIYVFGALCLMSILALGAFALISAILLGLVLAAILGIVVLLQLHRARR